MVQKMARHGKESTGRSQILLARSRPTWQLFSACAFTVLVLCYFARSTRFGLNHGPDLPLRRLAIRELDNLPSGIRRPPQAPQLFNDSPETIEEKAKKSIASEKQIVDDIVKKTAVANATFENTIVPFTEQFDQADGLTSFWDVYLAVSNDTKLQEAVQAVLPNFTKASQETYLNEEFFKLVDTVFQKQKDDQTLNAESRKLLAGIRGDFIDSGVNLPAGKKRDRFRGEDQKLAKLANDFENAITADQTALWFTVEELNGINPVVLKDLEKGEGEHEGKLKVVVQSPEAGGCNMDCSNATTRQRLSIAGTKLAPSNVDRLKQIIVTRDDQARLLGYPNYATWAIKDNMAKTPKAVEDLLNKVQSRLSLAADQDAERLKAYKKKDTGKAEFLFPWDGSYYGKISTAKEFGTNPDFVKEFFPAVQTLRKVLDLYSKLFSLKFVRIQGKDGDALSPTGKAGDLLWHPDVELYAVWEGKGDDFVGYLYLDVFYREGKRGSAFMMPVVPGYETKDGKRHYPSAGLVTNSKKAGDDADIPSLMYRGDVENLLHEAGHCMHQLTSKTQYSRFHGPIGCPTDFLELPSQMMQNWAWVPAVLKYFSHHYTYLSKKYLDAWTKANKGKKQPPKTLPDSSTDSIRRSKTSYAAVGTLGQWGRAIYDQRIHRPGSPQDVKAIDVTKLWNTIRFNATRTDSPRVLGLDSGHGESTFSHLVGLYGAAYYSYLWSQVYAEDVFYTAFEKDPFSAETGYRWRKTVLEPGGTKDFFEILKEFLGREPNDEAFFRDIFEA